MPNWRETECQMINVHVVSWLWPTTRSFLGTYTILDPIFFSYARFYPLLPIKNSRIPNFYARHKKIKGKKKRRKNVCVTNIRFKWYFRLENWIFIFVTGCGLGLSDSECEWWIPVLHSHTTMISPMLFSLICVRFASTTTTIENQIALELHKCGEQSQISCNNNTFASLHSSLSSAPIKCVSVPVIGGATTSFSVHCCAVTICQRKVICLYVSLCECVSDRSIDPLHHTIHNLQS